MGQENAAGKKKRKEKHLGKSTTKKSDPNLN